MEFIAIASALFGVYLIGFTLGRKTQISETKKIIEFAKKMNDDWSDHCREIIDSYEEKLKVSEKESDNNV